MDQGCKLTSSAPVGSFARVAVYALFAEVRERPLAYPSALARHAFHRTGVKPAWEMLGAERRRELAEAGFSIVLCRVLLCSSMGYFGIAAALSATPPLSGNAALAWSLDLILAMALLKLEIRLLRRSFLV